MKHDSHKSRDLLFDWQIQSRVQRTQWFKINGRGTLIQDPKVYKELRLLQNLIFMKKPKYHIFRRRGVCIISNCNIHVYLVATILVDYKYNFELLNPYKYRINHCVNWTKYGLFSQISENQRSKRKSKKDQRGWSLLYNSLHDILKKCMIGFKELSM